MGNLHLLIMALLVLAVTAAVTTPSTTTTTVKPASCSDFDGKCDQCVASSAGCFYCYKDDKCHTWPSGKVLPPSDVCSLDDARWGVCWLNFKVLLITMGVLAAILIITCSCFIYCCCCRPASKRRRNRAQKDEDRWELEREERRQRAEERKMERQARADEIRAKYGINKGPGSNYQKFENDDVA